MKSHHLTYKIVASNRILFPRVITARRTLSSLRKTLRTETASIPEGAGYPLLAGLFYKEAGDFTLVREGRFSADHLHVFLGANKIWLATFALSDRQTRYHKSYGDQPYKTPLDMQGRPIEPDGLTLPISRLLDLVNLRQSPWFCEVPPRTGTIAIARAVYHFGPRGSRPDEYHDCFVMPDIKGKRGVIFIFVSGPNHPLRLWGTLPIKKDPYARPTSDRFVPVQLSKPRRSTTLTAPHVTVSQVLPQWGKLA